MHGRAFRSLPYLLLPLILFSGTGIAQTTQRTYQAGGAGGTTDTVTRSCYIRMTGGAGSSVNHVTENGDLIARSALAHPLVDFPHIFGGGPDQVPPGATITAATLRLRCTNAFGTAAVQRPIRASLLWDQDQLGTWHEPTSSVVEALNQGVDWYHRDSRPGIERMWRSSGTTMPSSTNTSQINAFQPTLNPQIVVDISSTPDPGTFGVGEWHEWDVRDAVGVMSDGLLSHQGWILENSTTRDVVYASDDHPNASFRPQLVVRWATGSGGSPANIIPHSLTTAPATIATQQAVDVGFVVGATDDEFIDYVVIVPPEHGELLQWGSIFRYRPEPEFTGTDSFTWIARDNLTASFPKTTSISVAATNGTSTLAFQEGVAPMAAPANGETRMTSTRLGGVAQATIEDEVLRLSKPSDAGTGRQVYLEFPELIGPGSRQVPPGSQIVSARLELGVSDVFAAGTDHRVITLRRVIDPLDRGTSWHEPAAVAPEPSGCSDCGVSFLHPDARDSSEFWRTPGGDLHPFEAATLLITPEDNFDFSRTVDVTRAVQKWSDGEPNMGWSIRSSSEATTVLWGDDAPVAGNRPRLIVNYRPPSESPSVPVATSPHADAGNDQAVFENQHVELDASGSFHPSGGLFSTFWFQIGGPSVNLSSTVSHRPTFVAPSVNAPTQLEFLYAAFVSPTVFSVDTCRVLVMPQPGGTSYASPTVNAGPNQTVAELDVVPLNGTASAANGGVLSYRWTKVSGPPVTLIGANTPNATFTAPSVNSTSVIVFDLEVTEVIAGFTSTRHDTTNVAVQNSSHQPPHADPGSDRTVEPGTWVVLDATASFDPEGQAIDFTWVQLSGPPVNVSTYQTQGVGAASITPIFVPAVGAPTVMSLRLDVHDGELIGSAILDLTIDPGPTPFAGSLTSSPMASYRNQLTAAEARHLLRRVGTGIHPDDVAAARAAGLTSVVQATLAPGTTVDTDVTDEALGWAVDIISPSNADPPLNQPFDPYPRYTPAQVEAHWLTHAFRSDNVLLERMARFWHDRLSASCAGLTLRRRHWGVTHADMLRTRAYGNYRDMLIAFLEDPVTLSFIDGFDSIAFAPNENLAREFMELHTLGLRDENGQPIYTEQDVTEAARALTGWTTTCIAITPGSESSCYPAFSSFFHDPGSKTVLGMTDNYDDVGLVDLVLAHDGGDNAARWLARGLLECFVVHDPPEPTIAALAAVILQNSWEIEPSLETLLTSRAMFAPEARRGIVVSPVDYTNGLVRTLRVPLQTHDIIGNAGTSLMGQLTHLGQRLGRPIDVDGFPDDLEWMDEFTVVRRSEATRRILLLGVSPSVPNPIMPGGDYPGVAQTPVSLESFLPPLKARTSAEVLRSLLDHLDIELKTTPANGFSQSEFDLVAEYLDTSVQADGGAPSGYTTSYNPFDAEDPDDLDKLWGVIKLLLDHPDAHRF